MRNKICYILLFMICLGSVSSCKKFLDLAPESSATTGNAYQTAQDMEAALIGLYTTFYGEYFIWDDMLLGDVRSDNAYSGGDGADINQYDLLKISTVNTRVFANWQLLYNGISKANLILEKIDGVKDPALDLNQRRAGIIAEAKFIRAYMYFELVKMYGPVPLVTKFGAVEPSQANVPRSSENDVYAAILKDLQDALVLPDSYDNASLSTSRITKGAVNAMLARVSAQMPGRDYKQVLSYCDAVINSPAGYQLSSSYTSLFDGSNYVNKEVIFQIQFIENTPQANWGPQLVLPPSITKDDWRKYSTPSKDLVRAYDDEGDKIRKNANITFDNAAWADEYWKPCATSGQIPFVYKWKHASGWASGDYICKIRLADILLLKAEALNETGNGSEALGIVNNQIRKRVNLPPVTAATPSAIRDAILKERRLELAFEGQRWYDLVRMNKLIDVMGNLKEYVLSCDGSAPVQVNYGITAEKSLLPIPQSEINRNPQLTQNKGY
ncbi:RagB/SusD family nutrient uptake outer membrane protein [Chitinophaga sp. 212800010-3]|uniref:RagB/SusD family nutrient uptake outer membrane protein n=1 Tax=unclassified Chitinophaga TaxID=2619133 RepID=UPI002DE2150E|nr:Starch-binding associating with outer membrane [Chitinophaga sp. 212800010-3]